MNALPRLAEEILIQYVSKPGDQCGKIGEAEGKRLLMDIAFEFFAKLKAATGIDMVEAERYDISAETRYEQALTGNYEKYFADLCAQVKQYGVALKAPTETSNPKQVRDRLKAMEESGNYPHIDFSEENIERCMHLLRQSPNDVLRNAINAVAIIREHEPVPSLYKPPVLASKLNIRTFGADSFYEESPNGLRRRFDIEAAKQYARDLVDEALDTGTMKIVIMGKYTISDLDEQFKAIVEDAVIEYNQRQTTNGPSKSRDELLKGPLKCEIQLSDSAMAKIVRGGFGDCLIATLPDNANRLEAINKIDRNKINQDPEVANQLKPMSVYRIATGYGYGEKLNTNDGVAEETYTMEPNALAGCAKLAAQDAKRKNVPLTVVLPVDDEDHDFNQIFINSVLGAIGSSGVEFNFVTSGKFYADMVTDPSNSNYQVILSGNACGDHITDIMPAIHVPELGPAILGIGESRIVSVEDNEDGTVRVKNWIMEASAGTVVDLESIERNSEILPAGFLLAICRYLAESPAMSEEVHNIGHALHDRIMNILQTTGKGRKDWSNLNNEIFEEEEPIAA